MGKPHGLALGMTKSGPTMRVTRPTRTEDAVWDAVQKARIRGWSPKRFLREVEAAWKDDVKQQARREKKEARHTFRAPE